MWLLVTWLDDKLGVQSYGKAGSYKEQEPHCRGEQTMVGPRVVGTGRSSGKWYKMEMA